jgi:Protein of unknown function (DUF2939)
MKIVIGAGAIILIALGWITWPYYALYDFSRGMQQGDQVALEHRVAWDSVRQGLRDDFNAIFLESFSKNVDTSSPLSTGLVALFGPTLINNVIDSYVTPRGLANLVRSGKAPIPDVARTFTGADQTSASRFDGKQKDRLPWEQVRFAFFSGGPLTFRVDIIPDSAQPGDRPVTLLFKWAGDWKLARLFLPLDAIQNTKAEADKAKHNPVVSELTQAEADATRLPTRGGRGRKSNRAATWSRG